MNAGDIDPTLTSLVAEKLTSLTREQFKGTDLDFNSPDLSMLNALELNSYHFASAKNYQQIISMSAALRNDAGKVRGWKDFRNEASKINAIYNESWLRTEYETALTSAQSAARWVEFSNRKDKTTILVYDAVNDERTRESHAALDKIKKPIDDQFWNDHYPPNGFRCRCGVYVAGSGTRETLDSKIPNVSIPTMFRTNMAKDGVLFPLSHPYYIGAPEDVRKKGESLYVKSIKREVTRLFSGKKIECPAIKSKVDITTSGIKEAFNQPHYDKITKAQSLRNINTIIRDAEYVSSADNLKSDKNIKQFHYLSFMLKGVENYVVIKELWNGSYLFYSIVQSLKKQ